jgi:hypothetical protein
MFILSANMLTAMISVEEANSFCNLLVQKLTGLQDLGQKIAQNPNADFNEAEIKKAIFADIKKLLETPLYQKFETLVTNSSVENIQTLQNLIDTLIKKTEDISSLTKKNPKFCALMLKIALDSLKTPKIANIVSRIGIAGLTIFLSISLTDSLKEEATKSKESQVKQVATSSNTKVIDRDDL